MRKLSVRDGIATVALLAVLIPYVGYLIRGEMPFIEDPRGMAAVGLIGLMLAVAAWGFRSETTFGKIMLIAILTRPVELNGEASIAKLSGFPMKSWVARDQISRSSEIEKRMNSPSCQRSVPWNQPPAPSAGIVMPHGKVRDAPASTPNGCHPNIPVPSASVQRSR